MSYANINANGQLKTVQFDKNTKISHILRNSGLSFDMPCAGAGTCGKCQVQVIGNLSEITPEEDFFLTDEDKKENIRLACFAKACGDVEIHLDNTEISVVSWSKSIDIPLSFTGYGIAVDIGTTTVALRVYDRKTGKVLSEQLSKNVQQTYGADVISRIESCEKYGVEHLSKLIWEQLNELADKALEGLNVDEISNVVICGNTTMLHILENLNPASLAVAPFDVVSFFGENSKYTLKGAPVYLPHCIGAYIGADIVCAVLSSGMLNDEKTSLLIDIGTNGEMALHKDGNVYCVSTAAGPAFEGAGLYMGMNALSGAISKVWLEDDEIKFESLGDDIPCGICGSGIIDLMNVLVQTEIIDETGAFCDEHDKYEICEINDKPAFKVPNTDVYIIQEDIRQIQLAKSAICAGVLTLMNEAKVDFNDIGTLYIAGGFGHHLDKTSAANIGLFPKELLEKVEVIGNAALGGSSMMLLSKDCNDEIAKVIPHFDELPLSKSEFFMDAYVDNMFF